MRKFTRCKQCVKLIGAQDEEGYILHYIKQHGIRLKDMELRFPEVNWENIRKKL